MAAPSPPLPPADGVILRPMTTADLDAAHALSDELRWPHRLADWEQAFRHAEGVVAERDGQTLGTALRFRWGPQHATIGLVIPATFAFLIGGGEGTGPGDPEFFSIEALTVGVALLLLLTYAAQTWFFLRSPESPASAHGEDEPPEWSWKLALGVLLASAAALTVVSEILVHTLEPAVASLGISEFFIGIIVIPVIGNLAEHVVGVTLAYKNKMDFSLITSIGSATQIALFAVPVLVFFGLLVGQPLTLVFTPLEVVSVGVGVLIASYIALDGKSNWVEGLQLVSVYLIVAIAFFFLT